MTLAAFQAQQGPDYRAFVDRVTPQTTAAEMAGRAGALDFVSKADELKRSQEMQPIIMRNAELSSRLLQSQVANAEAMNSVQMLDLAAKNKMLAMQMEKEKAEDDLRGVLVRREYDEWASQIVPKLTASLDYNGLARFSRDAVERFGPDMRHTMSSPYAVPEIRKSLDDTERSEYDRLFRGYRVEDTIKSRNVNEKVRAVMQKAAQEDYEATLAAEGNDLIGNLNWGVIAADGDKGTGKKTSDKVLSDMFYRLEERAKANPDMVAEANLFHNLGERYGASWAGKASALVSRGIKSFNPFALGLRNEKIHNFALEHKVLSFPLRVLAMGEGSARWYNEDANEIVRNIDSIRREMDSNDKVKVERATKMLKEMVLGMADITPGFISGDERARMKTIRQSELDFIRSGDSSSGSIQGARPALTIAPNRESAGVGDQYYDASGNIMQRVD